MSKDRPDKTFTTWICTDPDLYQYGIQISKTSFLFKEWNRNLYNLPDFNALSILEEMGAIINLNLRIYLILKSKYPHYF